MRKYALICFILLMVAPAAKAAEETRAEISGLYSYISFDADGQENLEKGFGVDVSLNIKDNLAFVSSFSGNYEEGGHLYYYMAGLRYIARAEQVAGFVHATFGGASLGDGISDDAFAMGFGGGFDMPGGDADVVIRVFQFDYLPTNFNDDWFHNIRIQAGIVFRLH